MPLCGEVVPVDALSDADRQRMVTILAGHFAGVTAEMFRRDLREKEWAIVLRAAATGQIVGFSTQTVLRVNVAGRVVRALFSGDTIVERNYWGDTELIRVWGDMALQLADGWPDEPFYWFLISMGYKTYRFLPVFFHEFYPRYDVPTPPHEQAVLDALAASRYADRYDPRTGVISPAGRRVCLRPGIADVDARRLRDPHVRYFTARNPGHGRGDELACLAPICRENLKPRAHAIIARGVAQPTGA